MLDNNASTVPGAKATSKFFAQVSGPTFIALILRLGMIPPLTDAHKGSSRGTLLALAVLPRNAADQHAISVCFQRSQCACGFALTHSGWGSKTTRSSVALQIFDLFLQRPRLGSGR